MITTSVAVAATLIANLVSDIVPIRAFGVYAAIFVLVNCLVVSLFFMPMLTFYEANARYMKCLEEPKRLGQRPVSPAANLSFDVSREYEGERAVDEFFKTSFYRGVKWCRWPIVIIFLAWGGLVGYVSKDLEIESSEQSYFPNGFWIKQLHNWNRYDFTVGNAKGINVDLFWGVRDLITTDVDFWEMDDLGELIFDEQFDLSSVEAQQSILDICADLRLQNFVFADPNSVDCWLEDFLPDGVPIESDFDDLLWNWVQTDPKGQKMLVSGRVGFVNERIRYFVIKVLSTALPDSPQPLMEPVYEDWENYLEIYRINAPVPLRSVRQNAGKEWALMKAKEELRNSAITAMILAAILVMLVLLVATQNIVLTLALLLSIAIAAVTNLAIAITLDWRIGLKESICLISSIALSLDFNIHMSLDF